MERTFVIEEVEEDGRHYVRATLSDDLMEWGHGDTEWEAIAEYCLYFPPPA